MVDETVARARWGRTGHSPEKPWYPAWKAVRDRLRLTHVVSAALAHGSLGLEEALRDLGRMSADRRIRGLKARGEAVFAMTVEVLAEIKPEVPVRRADEDALVRLLWWYSAGLGLSRSDIGRLVDGSYGMDVVADAVAKTATAAGLAALDRMMWRTGSPPVRGGSPAGLERIVRAFGEATAVEPGDTVLEAVWAPLAVERCRLTKPGVLALAAMLAHLADEPFDLRPLIECHVRLSPVALADACQSARQLRRTVAEGVRHGLITGDVGASELPSLIRGQVRESLTAAERRFGAQAAISAMDCVYPPQTYRAKTWERAGALRAHAYAASLSSEELDVGESWRSYVLERLCIFDYEHGRITEAADAGRRALRAGEASRQSNDRLADILVNYGRALAALGKFTAADRTFRRALDLERSNNEEQAKTLNIYANVLKDAGRSRKEDQARNRALSLVESPEHYETRADVLHDLSLSLSSRRRYSDAMKALHEAEQLVPLRSETGLLIQARIAATLNDQEQFDEALHAIDAVLPSFRETWGTVSWPHVNALHIQGIAFEGIARKTGRPKDTQRAEAAYRKYRLIRDKLEANPEAAPGTSEPV